MIDTEGRIARSRTTATSTDVRSPDVSETLVTSLLLVSATAGLRDRTTFLSEDTKDLNRQALLHNLDVRTGPKARMSSVNLLTELSARGFAWSTVAKLVGVTVPALRKWRQGESATGANRRRLARLAALCELLEGEYAVEDVAGWMEVPLTSEAPITPVDFYDRDRLDLLLDWAAHRVDPYVALDEAFPGWYVRYRSDFEVFKDDDGLALRLKDE